MISQHFNFSQQVVHISAEYELMIIVDPASSSMMMYVTLNAITKKVLPEQGMKCNKSCVICLIAYDSARVHADSVVLHSMDRGEG
jgi:hypothetical protein